MAAQTLKDKVPPHNDDAERAALGAMLLENEAVVKSVSKIDPEDFYSLANGSIFRAIKSIYNAGGRRADIITVCDELNQNKQLDIAGGEAYIASLTNVVPTAANIDYYLEVIRDNAMRRSMITIASKITAKSYDISQKSEEILEKAQQFIFELIEERQQYKYKSIRELISETLPLMEEQLDKEYTGIRSGYRDQR